MDDQLHGSVAEWAKRCHLAGRATMDAMLRPYDLGATQWYVLHRLAEGPILQRDLLRLLQVERATLSVVIGALVRKGFVEQAPHQVDQRKKWLRMTEAGGKLWVALPDLTVIRATAFEGMNKCDLAAAVRVLRTATERLGEVPGKETSP